MAHDDGWIFYKVDVPRLITLTAENLWSWRFLKGYNLWMCVDRLSTFMRHATCRYLIGWCIGSKRRFVFRASLIYITYFSSFISTIFSQKLLSERSHHIRTIFVPVDYSTVNNHLLSVLSTYSHFFQVAFCAYISVRATHPSVLLDPSVLGFIVNWRQCLVR